MNAPLKRPEKKYANVKVTDEDMIYFSLGIDREEFILPSQRNTYLSDARAVALVEAVKAGKDLSGQDFSNINLKGADISGGRFVGSKFTKAAFYETKAVNCDFTDADFSDSYIEKTDFTNSSLRGISYKRTFARDNDFTGALVDADAVQFLTTLEKIILLIEQGKIDIRMLSKEDLLCLDIRRLDFTNIDLNDLDLSIFALDGINLCGTYIDPKQLMSQKGLKQYYLDVQKLKEKKRREEALELMQDKQEQLEHFSKKQLADKNNKEIKTSSEKLKLPPLKIKEKIKEESDKKFEPRVIIAANKETLQSSNIPNEEIQFQNTSQTIKEEISPQNETGVLSENMFDKEKESNVSLLGEAVSVTENPSYNKISPAFSKDVLQKEGSSEKRVESKEKSKEDNDVTKKTKKSYFSAFRVATKFRKPKKIKFKIKG